jgi:hypothetical protein
MTSNERHPLHPSDRAWLALLCGVLTYNIVAPAGETLSEGADRYMVRHKLLTRVIGVSLVAHVCNYIPCWCDPIHGLFLLVRRVYLPLRGTLFGRVMHKLALAGLTFRFRQRRRAVPV